MMGIPMKKAAFTLLEVVIVIIIVGVLVALAIPRLVSVIESSRAAEVLSAFGTIRAGMERCKLMNDNSYDGCVGFYSGDFSKLGIDNPQNSPGAHFEYWGNTYSDSGKEAWWIAAMRVDERGDALYGDGCYFMVMTYGIKSYNFWRDINNPRGSCDGYFTVEYDDQLRYEGQKEVSGFLPGSGSN